MRGMHQRFVVAVVVLIALLTLAAFSVVVGR